MESNYSARYFPADATTTDHPASANPADLNTDDTNTKKIPGSIAGLIIAAIIIILLCVLKRKCRHHQQQQRKRHSARQSSGGEIDDEDDDEEEDEDEDEDDELKEVIDESMRRWNELSSDVKSSVKYYLLNAAQLTMGTVLGKGQFGMVYQASLCKTGRNSNDYGKISHEKVAVKTLKGSNIDKETIEAFLREGMIMKEFKHKNVLGLLGVALGDHGIPMIVLPFMANGNLKKYIGKAHLLITVRELLVFGKEVAEGMKYLADNKFVHRDLAARNCMLDDMFSVKVADFGLSRDMHEKEYYSSTDTKAKLPVKWMALESIANSVYTSKSDVWSYGVVLWELLTRGATPYPDVANWDVFSYIRSGRRMPQPHLCPDVVYVLMKECWIPNPLERPDFGEIITRLEEIIEPPTRQSSVATEDDDDYYNLYVNVEVDDYVQPD